MQCTQHNNNYYYAYISQTLLPKIKIVYVIMKMMHVIALIITSFARPAVPDCCIFRCLGTHKIEDFVYT